MNFTDQPQPGTRAHSGFRLPMIAIVFLLIVATVVIVQISKRQGEVVHMPAEPVRAADESAASLRNPGMTGAIFETGNPIPQPFSSLKPGMRLSQIQFSHPEGHYSAHLFTIQPLSGPFSQLTLYFDEDDPDPAVKWIIYCIRNQVTIPPFRVALLEALAGYECEISTDAWGATPTWTDAGGYWVRLRGPYYTVSAVERPTR